MVAPSGRAADRAQPRGCYCVLGGVCVRVGCGSLRIVVSLFHSPFMMFKPSKQPQIHPTRPGPRLPTRNQVMPCPSQSCKRVSLALRVFWGVARVGRVSQEQMIGLSRRPLTMA